MSVTDISVCVSEFQSVKISDRHYSSPKSQVIPECSRMFELKISDRHYSSPKSFQIVLECSS